ncbi:MAG: alpha/beta hydrolase-fold protein [Actinomycetota bacterium]|nr:alpha/beta hydrolase-fold protein [Actinomycetota bacterium]
MDYGQLERSLRGCYIEPDDTEAERVAKRERRRQAERDLELLLARQEPTGDEAYALARILSHAGPGHTSTLERARELAHVAHTKGHPEAGRLFATCVDRLLVADGEPQRYGTLRMTVAGEIRCPDLDPSVTDDERAALGLPPAAQVREEVARTNREAARRVAEEGLPPGVNLRRVLRRFRPAELERVLGDRREGVWREGDDVFLCWRGQAEAVTAWFGVEMAMEPLDGTDLWVLAVRIRDVDRAAFSYRFLPAGGSETPMWGERSGTWQGPLAPPPPERARPLGGELRTVDFPSEVLGERRTLELYLPPGHDADGRNPVLYATDSRTSAELLEPLITEGRIPPVVSVGVPFGRNLDGDRRAQEYLPGFHAERFDAHRRFFVEELPAWAEAEVGVTSDRRGRAVFGVSNGAAFAAAMGVLHPEHFGTVIAFSLGIAPGAPAWPQRGAPRHYLCAGTLEEGFLLGTQRWAERVHRAGAEVVLRTWVSGHDMVMWDGELPLALEWAFAHREPGLP